MAIVAELGLRGPEGMDQAGRMVTDFMAKHRISRDRTGRLSNETLIEMATADMI